MDSCSCCWVPVLVNSFRLFYRSGIRQISSGYTFQCFASWRCLISLCVLRTVSTTENLLWSQWVFFKGPFSDCNIGKGPARALFSSALGITVEASNRWLHKGVLQRSAHRFGVYKLDGSSHIWGSHTDSVSRCRLNLWGFWHSSGKFFGCWTLSFDIRKLSKWINLRLNNLTMTVAKHSFFRHVSIPFGPLCSCLHLFIVFKVTRLVWCHSLSLDSLNIILQVVYVWLVTSSAFNGMKFFSTVLSIFSLSAILVLSFRTFFPSWMSLLADLSEGQLVSLCPG